MPFVTASLFGLGTKDKGQSTVNASNFGDSTKFDQNRFEQQTGEGHDVADWVPAQPGEQGAFLDPVTKQWKKQGTRRVYTNTDRNINYYRGLGDQAQQRQGVQVDYTQANQAREAQMRGLGYMESAARGDAPSRAELLGRSMADDAARNQIAMAGMAGGGPAGALAARTGMGQAADIQRRVGIDMAGLRADEMARAREQYIGAGLGIGSQDAARAQYQAQLQAQQRALNDQYAMGMQGMGADMIRLKAQQDMAQQQLLAGSHTSADNANVQRGMYNAGQEWGAIDRFVGAGQGSMGMAMGAFGKR